MISKKAATANFALYCKLANKAATTGLLKDKVEAIKLLGSVFGAKKTRNAYTAEHIRNRAPSQSRMLHWPQTWEGVANHCGFFTKNRHVAGMVTLPPEHVAVDLYAEANGFIAVRVPSYWKGSRHAWVLFPEDDIGLVDAAWLIAVRDAAVAGALVLIGGVK